jgi:hypothetical protein
MGMPLFFHGISLVLYGGEGGFVELLKIREKPRIPPE